MKKLLLIIAVIILSTAILPSIAFADAGGCVQKGERRACMRQHFVNTGQREKMGHLDADPAGN
ncbi:hypothetical protein [Aminivibrio sp.]|uniref:hypothetical protein n=1 Tax=Aminivibrio sp. TaxID=1872489 RepID=UPI00345E36B7